MTERWTIRLLGGFEVTRGDHAAVFETRKTAALLAYLAFYSDRSHAREALADMLWPGADEAAAQKRLRQALSALRRSLGHTDADGRPSLRCDAGLVGLYGIVTDVATFRQTLEQARAASGKQRRDLLEAANTLYRGPLLHRFDEEWIAAERAAIDDTAYAALRLLTAARTAAGEVKSAISAALRAAGIDPLREGARRDLMELYAVSGRTSDSLRQFESYTALLEQELAAKPSPRMTELAASMRAGEYRVAAARNEAPAIRRQARFPAPASRFFGRELEIARLTGMALSNAHGPERSTGDEPWRSRLITLTGAPGSGKTRLAMELARHIVSATGRRAAFVSLSVVGHPGGIEPAILEACGLEADAQAEPAALLSAVFNEQPAMIVLDNFEHLADAGAEVVLRLVNRTPGVFWLVTSRHRLDIEGERE